MSLSQKWKLFTAWMHTDLKAVCEMSVNGKDYHRYEDTNSSHLPVKGCIFFCRRCGKAFEL